MSTTQADRLDTDTIHAVTDLFDETEIVMVYVTPDGVGRYFYDTIEEAQAQHGDDLPIVYWDSEYDDEAEHEGHRTWLTGAWYCDTCDSPYCSLA